MVDTACMRSLCRFSRATPATPTPDSRVGSRCVAAPDEQRRSTIDVATGEDLNMTIE